jgi:hypothetical protein
MTQVPHGFGGNKVILQTLSKPHLSILSKHALVATNDMQWQVFPGRLVQSLEAFPGHPEAAADAWSGERILDGHGTLPFPCLPAQALEPECKVV